MQQYRRWILYNWRQPAQCWDWEAAPKHLPKTNLRQKTPFFWSSDARLSHHSFLNPGRNITCERYAQQTAEMQVQACSRVSQQNRPASPQRPTAHHIIHASKGETTGLRGFASSAIFTWPHANWLPLFQASWQLSIGKLLPQPAEGRKYFPRVHLIHKHRFLDYSNKQN